MQIACITAARVVAFSVATLRRGRTTCRDAARMWLSIQLSKIPIHSRASPSLSGYPRRSSGPTNRGNLNNHNEVSTLTTTRKPAKPAVPAFCMQESVYSERHQLHAAQRWIMLSHGNLRASPIVQKGLNGVKNTPYGTNFAS